jgi:ABC-type branched-subunit amino acid transport system ATPase component/ABC-type branched-subunit amino acid transport system permease subunit
MNKRLDSLVIRGHRELRWALPLALVVILFLVPQLGGDQPFRLGQYELILSFLIMIVALNIAMGIAGQYLLGITAVFAVGGYGAALVAQHHPKGVGLAVMCVLGAAIGGLGGLVIGLPALRVGGFYLALVSLYAAVAIPTIAQNWKAVGGESGVTLFAVPGFAPQIAGLGLYYIVLALVVLVTVFSWALVRSRVGHRFIALHTSEQLSASVGVTSYRTKLLAILISSVIAGLGGGVYVYSQQFFSPSSSTSNLATLLLAGLVIGGMGTIVGPIIGGVVILGLNTFLTAFQSYNGIVFGLVLIVASVYLPDGLVARLKLFAVKATSRAEHSAATVRSPSPPRVGAGPAAGSAATDGRGPGPADPATMPSWGPVIGLDTKGPLRTSKVRRAFGGVVAVDEVDLVVERGTIHGLIGSNGSGKTTLLNLISGFYRLDSGEIHVGATRLDNRPPYATARAGVARTFQSPKLVLHETALENVIPAVELRLACTGVESVLRFPRGIRTHREARAEALEALDALGLHSIVHDQADSLPHGTRRLVELARAIAMRPSFILLDEPAAGLSTAELDILVRAIRNLADSGVGVLLIEHNIPAVLSLADSVTVLHQGKLLFHGTPDELRANQEVANAFLGMESEHIEAPR